VFLLRFHSSFSWISILKIHPNSSFNAIFLRNLKTKTEIHQTSPKRAKTASLSMTLLFREAKKRIEKHSQPLKINFWWSNGMKRVDLNIYSGVKGFDARTLHNETWNPRRKSKAVRGEFLKLCENSWNSRSISTSFYETWFASRCL
jgi:hypothetical protein